MSAPPGADPTRPAHPAHPAGWKSDGLGVATRTLGCRLNAHESTLMALNARRAGVNGAIIVNTCAVTAEAVRQSRQAIRRARRDRPDATVIASGCAVQVDPEAFAAMPEIDVLLGNADKTSPMNFAEASSVGSARKESALKESAERHIQPIQFALIARRSLAPGVEKARKARAYVQVQAGCDHSCTFCIIPRGRGRSVSSPVESILSEIESLVAAGYYEIVLTGVDIGSWGSDLAPRSGLGDLVSHILSRAEGIGVLRLSSLDVADIDASLIDVFGRETRLAPHLHLSLQSGHDMILKRMKRRHRRADVVNACARLRDARPDIALGADMIAGFPTETDAMFSASMSVVEECGLDYLHVFPFSPRPDVPASRMPPVLPALIRERAARLRRLGSERLVARLDRHVGKTARVVVGHGNRGRLPDYAPVCIDGSVPDSPVVDVRLTGRDDDCLRAQVIA